MIVYDDMTDIENLYIWLRFVEDLPLEPSIYNYMICPENNCVDIPWNAKLVNKQICLTTVVLITKKIYPHYKLIFIDYSFIKLAVKSWDSILLPFLEVTKHLYFQV